MVILACRPWKAQSPRRHLKTLDQQPRALGEKFSVVGILQEHNPKIFSIDLLTVLCGLPVAPGSSAYL